MIVKSVAMQAYQNALKTQQTAQGLGFASAKKAPAQDTGFMNAMKGSL